MDKKSIDSILNEFYKEAVEITNVTIIRGEFGIGKSFYFNKFLKSNTLEKKDIIQIDAHPFDLSCYSTLNQAIYKYISKKDIDINTSRNIFMTLAQSIPRFGQFISSILDPNLFSNSLNEVIKRAGVNTEGYNLLGLLNFFEEQSNNTSRILYCTNIQWFDRSSLEAILQLLYLFSEKKWMCILSYATNIETPVLSHQEIDNMINRLQQDNNGPSMNVINIERWDRENITSLCENILKKNIALSNIQYDLIYQYTEGLPLYVVLILDAFTDNGYMLLNGNTWTSDMNWDSDKVRAILKDIVKEKISSVYRKFPESQEILETGSVFCDDFTNVSICEIFEPHNDITKILYEVENRFRIIKYITESGIWKFEHFLIKDYIYRSLGEKSKSLHFKIGQYLETRQTNHSLLTIAKHYQLAGEIEKAVTFSLKEIELLLNSGCFFSAQSLVNEVKHKYEFELTFNDKFKFLEGRTQFHNAQYSTALNIFESLLNCTSDSTIRAKYSLWLARVFLKLDSQNHFLKALTYLEDAKKTNNSYAYGDLLLEFIVAYAHLNNKEKAEELYIEAEHYFNASKDKIGMLRLHRKSIIFMEAKVSVGLLVKTAQQWGRLNVMHEKIMCLNNAAVQYLYLQRYDDAKNTLEEALENSRALNGFGKLYLINNMGLVNIFMNNNYEAHQNFNIIANNECRSVEKLIININQGALLFAEKGGDIAYSRLNELYKIANAIGENAYIVPTTINLGLAFIEKNEIDNAIIILKSIQNIIHEYSSFELAIWYNALIKCYTINQNCNLINDLQNTFVKSVNSYLLNYPDSPQVAYITIEFWSDN